MGKGRGFQWVTLATQRGQVPSAVNKVLLLRTIVNLYEFCFSSVSGHIVPSEPIVQFLPSLPFYFQSLCSLT